jgi:hypothetical protein
MERMDGQDKTRAVKIVIMSGETNALHVGGCVRGRSINGYEFADINITIEVVLPC